MNEKMEFVKGAILTPMKKQLYRYLVKDAKNFVPDTILHGTFENFDEFRMLWNQPKNMRNKFPADLFKEDKIVSPNTRFVVTDERELVIDVSFDPLFVPSVRPKKWNDALVDCGFIHISTMDIAIRLKLNLYDLTLELGTEFVQLKKSVEETNEELFMLKNYLKYAKKIATTYLYIWYGYQLAKNVPDDNLINFRRVFLLSGQEKMSHEQLMRQHGKNRKKYYTETYLNNTYTILTELYNSSLSFERNSSKKKVLYWSRGIWMKNGKYRSGSFHQLKENEKKSF